ncbi:MAG: SAM-dependent chlorinase/fluorinase, partial [Dehalococcoidia bacterium]|nr:SAM-dependent chlorinase/fluorinase [Dehalococcoidia bacterium]
LFTDVAAADGATVDHHALILADHQRAWALDVARFGRHPMSRTFHGRDLFAPVAGYLAAGGDPQALGVPMRRLVALARPAEPHIAAIDHFGNLITSVAAAPNTRYTVIVGDRAIAMTDGSYGDATDVVVVVNSSGRLEIAVPNGSAAALLGLRPGDPITVRATTSPQESA